MPNTKRFSITHTESTTAPAAKVWALWSDVNNWPSWDVGLEHCVLDGDFTAGQSFSLRPRGAPDAIRANLVEVLPNRGFTDETRLPFGVLRAKHAFDNGTGGNTVTHTIEADIAAEQVDFFAKVIWAGMEKGLPESVRNLIKAAEARA
jgi:Polyketide cyclase / dehydrase and lipid transport